MDALELILACFEANGLMYDVIPSDSDAAVGSDHAVASSTLKYTYIYTNSHAHHYRFKDKHTNNKQMILTTFKVWRNGNNNTWINVIYNKK